MPTLSRKESRDYNYTKDGRKIKGSQYKVKLEFSKEK